MEVVGTACSRSALLSDESAANADVLLLDLYLAGENTADSLSSLRERCTGRVLVLTGTDDLEEHRRAVIRGAHGVVHKSEPAEMLLRAIEKVSEGQIWMKQPARRGLRSPHLHWSQGHSSHGSSPRKDRQPNSARERDRLDDGEPRGCEADCGRRETRDERAHSANHLTTIYSKLQVRGRLEMHVFASAHGLGEPKRSSPDC